MQTQIQDKPTASENEEENDLSLASNAKSASLKTGAEDFSKKAKGWRRFLPGFVRRRFMGEAKAPGPVSLVRLNGPIGNAGRFAQSLSLQSLEETLKIAFKPKNLSAVALLVNSPGGSPVQSSLIGKRIRALAEEKEVPVYAFVEDVAASGGYWLACAADEIYLDESSMVGSIGVIAAGFGFTGAIEKLGVERRAYTSGENKLRLDAFQTEKSDDVAWVKNLQGQIHEIFRTWVKSRRGDKLKGTEAELMNGDVWIGAKAVELGLADGLADAESFLKEKFGTEVKLSYVAAKRGLGQRLGLGANLALTSKATAGSDMGDALTTGLVRTLEERMSWNRFGL